MKKVRALCPRIRSDRETACGNDDCVLIAVISAGQSRTYKISDEMPGQKAN